MRVVRVAYERYRHSEHQAVTESRTRQALGRQGPRS